MEGALRAWRPPSPQPQNTRTLSYTYLASPANSIIEPPTRESLMPIYCPVASSHLYRKSSIGPLCRAMSQARRPPKRFAPLDPQRSGGSGAPPLKGIVFDVDGTLWYVCFAVLWVSCCCGCWCMRPKGAGSEMLVLPFSCPWVLLG